MKRRMKIVGAALVGLAALLGSGWTALRSTHRSGDSFGAARVDFERDIAPIFRKHCVECHGPAVQEAGLRLDDVQHVLRGSTMTEVVVRGNSRSSLLIKQVAGEKPAMPPEGNPLRVREIGLLADWINHLAPEVAAGVPSPAADGAEHWAYRPLSVTPAPVSDADEWCRNEVDRHVRAGWAADGLNPAPEADRATLIRRLSLDITGLPPDTAEVDEFLADSRPDAYERLVDRLLASPHYGEHQAVAWLDLARYADTHGYHRDAYRAMWKYRDWVIDAFNRNLPYDQFTMEQLAGDLLDDPTPEQLIATGFHRNTMFNQEGGVDPEEFRLKAVVDRTNTTAVVWLATTLGCAQCHNHPHDPFRQQEYYEFLAFFNSTQDGGGGKYEQPHPLLEFPNEEQRAVLTAIRTEIAARRAAIRQADKGPTTDDAELGRLLLKEERLLREVPTTLVLRECPEPRTTRVLIRGNAHTPGLSVEPNTPRVLAPFPAGLPRNRLGLARWLVSPENPLAARAAVNRQWKRLFGRGLVDTPGDFGVRGDVPLNPSLLDFLATEFIRSGWDGKALLRQIVTSATYRQSSSATKERRRLDPDNRRYARAGRFRLEAEVLRSQSLAMAGLLDRTIGGPSVFPPQPAGQWSDVEIDYDNDLVWRESTGGSRYRRELYTFLRRSSPHPALVAFDAPSRETCVVQRVHTTTPLQALTALNGASFVEAAAGLARRILSEAPASIDERVRYGWRLCLARHPTEMEATELTSLYATALEKLRVNPQAVAELPLPPPEGVDPAEYAAWIVTANVLLNLDAVLTRW